MRQPRVTNAPEAATPTSPAHDSAIAAPPDAAVNWRSLVSALSGTFVLRAASYAAGLMIPVHLGLKSRSDADVTVWLAAMISVVFYAAELTGAPVFGALSDRFGRKLFIVLGPIFGGVAIAMLGVTSIIPVLIVVRLLEGFSTASAAPSTLGYLSAETAASPRARGRVMGLYEAATVVGLTAGAAIGGQLYDRFGTSAFMLTALVYGLSLVLFLFVKDRPSVRTGYAHQGVFRRMLNRRIMRFAPAWLAANAVLGAWFSVGPFLATQEPNPNQFLMGGFSGSEVGIAFLAFGILFTAGAILWGFIMPMIGRQPVLLMGVGGLALTAAALWLLNHLPAGTGGAVVLLLVGLVMVGIFVESGFTPAALAYLAEIAEEHPEDRGSVMGVYSVLLAVGQLSGGALAAPFASAWGMNGLIVLTGLLCLVAAYTVILLGHIERRHATHVTSRISASA